MLQRKPEAESELNNTQPEVVALRPEYSPRYITVEQPPEEDELEDDTEEYEEGMMLDFEND